MRVDPVDTDTAYCFDLTFVIHNDDEAVASRALAKLLEAADEFGFKLVWERRSCD